MDTLTTVRTAQHWDSWEGRTSQKCLWLLGIVMLALGMRLAITLLTTSLSFPSEGYFWKFGYEMGQIAASLAAGKGFSWQENAPYYSPGQPTAWMPPVYPFIIAAAFKLFGTFSQQSAIALILFQTIISVLTCIALYFLGKRLYNVQVGYLAALLFAIYPPAIHFSVQKIWSTSLFTLFLLLIILIALWQVDHPSTAFRKSMLS